MPVEKKNKTVVFDIDGCSLIQNIKERKRKNFDTFNDTDIKNQKDKINKESLIIGE